MVETVTRHSSLVTRHSLRVAVIGARGIGKQHAKWFHCEGCEIVAFAGKNSEQISKTAQALKGLLPFAGRGYADTAEMLRVERPDVVAIASPHALHLTHLRLALEHGAHVYMEKPFVWTKRAQIPALLGEARRALDFASRTNRLVGINTQYVCAWDAYERFVGASVGNASSLFVEMESKSLGRARQFESVWVDLGSHPISMLQKLLPGGSVVEETACVQIGRNETRAKFTFRNDSGRELQVEFRCGSIDEGTPRRRFGVDGVLVDCGGRNDDAGVFHTVFTAAGREALFTDFMQESVRRFVQAVRTGNAELITASGVEGVRNLEIHLQLTELSGMSAESYS